MTDIKIAIGPLLRGYGGLGQHVKNIIAYSRYKLTPIAPSFLSLYYSNNRFKKYARFALSKIGLTDFDIYGLFISKIYLPRFDIVHLHGHPYWPAIYFKPRRNQHPIYIHTVHQIYLEEDCYNPEEWKIKQRLNSLMFKFCRSSHIVISVAKWQQKVLQKANINSVYIPNGINIKACELANPIRFRKKYKIEEDFYIFPGDIRKYKRPKLFIKLAKKLTNRLFIMIGMGVTKESLSRQLNIDIPRNILCLGALPFQDAIDAFVASRVFVLPSKNDTFPSALLEAMACKKAVVAANNCGPREIIIDGVDGFLFEPDNLENLYEKALIAWRHPEIGFQAYKKVKTKYDWPIIIEKIDSLYNNPFKVI